MKYNVLAVDESSKELYWIRQGHNFGRRKKYSLGLKTFAIDFETYEEAKAAIEYYKDNYVTSRDFYICVFEE